MASANPLQPSGWQVANADQTGQQVALSCVSPSWCMSVGVTGVQIWDGAAWKAAPSNLSKSFISRGLSCWNRHGCMVVGWVPARRAGRDDSGTPVAFRWGGATWHRLHPPRPKPGETAFSTVSCPATRTCFLVGDLASRALRWHSGTWTSARIPHPRDALWIHVYAIDCATAKSCHALGEVGFASAPPTPEYALIGWNGTKWKSTVTTGIYLSSISCATTTSCVAVGDDSEHLIGYSWNGTRWRKTVVPDSPNKYDDAAQEPNGYEQLTGVSCWSATGCQAVGVTNTAPFHRRWNGGTWSSVPNPGTTDDTGSSGEASYDVSGIACYDASFCVTAGSVTYGAIAGRTYMERYRP